MSSRFGIILAVIIVLFGGIFFFNKNKADAPSSGGSSSVKATEHFYGNTSSKVKLVEYGDFQCPACAAYYPVVKEVTEKYKDQISFQFVNFPLYQIHQNAFAAHRAAEAAHKQGKFWEMYDLLYTNNSAWVNSSTPTATFEQYAAQLGLNVEDFKKDSASSTINDIIWADINKGNDQKVNATPTFYLNDKKIEANIQSVEAFSKVIDEALKSAGN